TYEPHIQAPAWLSPVGAAPDALRPTPPSRAQLAPRRVRRTSPESYRFAGKQSSRRRARLEALRATDLTGTMSERVATHSFPSTVFPHRSDPGSLLAESRIPIAVLADLRGRGHRVKMWPDWHRRPGRCAW